MLDGSGICNYIRSGVAGEPDKAGSSAYYVESYPEKHLVDRIATRVSSSITIAAGPCSGSKKRLSNTNGPNRLVNGEGRRQCTLGISQKATVVTTEEKIRIRLIDKNSVQNLRIITNRLIKTVDTGVKTGYHDISDETSTSTRRRQPRIVRDQWVKNTITVNITGPIATRIHIRSITILS
jgi:hypothetical protein